MPRYFIVLLLTLTTNATVAQQECDGSTGRGSIACLKPLEKIKRLELKKKLTDLDKLMQSEGSPVNHAQYLQYLNESQAEWERYSELHCRLQGLAKSGPNTWSSYYALKCELEAIDQRMSALDKLEKILLMEDE